jgi:hypothetical protein
MRSNPMVSSTLSPLGLIDSLLFSQSLFTTQPYACRNQSLLVTSLLSTATAKVIFSSLREGRPSIWNLDADQVGVQELGSIGITHGLAECRSRTVSRQETGQTGSRSIMKPQREGDQ